MYFEFKIQNIMKTGVSCKITRNNTRLRKRLHKLMILLQLIRGLYKHDIDLYKR